MSEKTKDRLGAALTIAALAFAFASVGYVFTQPDFSERTFSVNGEGEVVVIPDIGTFTFSVLTEGGIDLSSLQEQNTKRSNAVTDYLKENGVDEEDIQSQDYYVNPRYQYSRCFSEDEICPPPEIVGYSIEHTISVKVRDLEKVGDILAGVVESGANTVSQLSFSVDDPTEVENEARAEAMEQAREKAKAIAKAGKFRLGKLVSVSEIESLYDERADYAFAEAYGRGGATPPSIEPGSEKVTVNVILVYEIK